MSKIKGIVIADQHFGIINACKLYMEHDGIILEFLKKKKSLDVVFIAGDYFDHIIYMNEDHAKYAYMFMDQLILQIKRLGAKLRIIYGTESHECNQYSVFTSKFINDSSIDVRVINTVTEEELFDDFWVLYLPEEYIYNKDDYYKEYLTGDKKYKYIIGHGVIQELMTTASYHINKATKDSKRAKVPVFTSNELLDNCCGQVYFGHYHVKSSILDKIFYVGSFSRWMFGEEEKKGFYYIETDMSNYTNEFIENAMCDTYKTISYGYDHPIFMLKENMISELSKVENIVKTGIYDHLRLILNFPETYEDAESAIVMVRERFKNHKEIKIEITNGFVSRSKKIDKEYLSESMNKYAEIFDKNIPIEEKAHQFILKKFEEDIPVERVKWHLITTDIMKEVDE